MKKNLFIICTGLIFASAFGCAQAAMQNIPPEVQAMLLDRASAQAKLYKPTWQKLYTCTPSKTDDGSLIIYGRSQDKQCHFKYSKFDCHLPSNIVKQYASAGIKNLDELSNGNFAANTEENDFMDKIHNTPEYCTIK